MIVALVIMTDILREDIRLSAISSLEQIAHYKKKNK